MHIELDPPRGVPPLLIGGALEEAVAAGAVWGEVTVSRGLDDAPSVLVHHPRIAIVAHIEDGDGVTAIEVGRPDPPRGPSGPRIAVTFHGVDVFATPARQVLARLAEQGHMLTGAAGTHPAAPGLTLGFTREPSDEGDQDTDGLPLHFDAVLVAPPGYYG